MTRTDGSGESFPGNRGRAYAACVACLAGLVAFVSPRAAEGACDPDSVHPSGAIYRICMPDARPWNGDLVLWAHDSVPVTQPLAIPEEQLTLPDGTSLPEVASQLGFAFATTSYRENGTAIVSGVEDMADLVTVFELEKGPVGHVYLTGASEGGLVTTLAVEKYPELFDGGLAACGPLGDFSHHVNFLGDFRVVFDEFFPDLVPGSALEIPEDLIANWLTYVDEEVMPEVLAPENASLVQELILVTGMAVDPTDFWGSVEIAIRDALASSVLRTNDLAEKLGGQPFQNHLRLYQGSSNDRRLNLRVERATADPEAIEAMRTSYDTSGVLTRPLVTLHTTLDQQVPFWHEKLYLAKAAYQGSLDYLTVLSIPRFGHCNFTGPEVLFGLNLLVEKAQGTPLVTPEKALPTAEARLAYRRLVGAP